MDALLDAMGASVTTAASAAVTLCAPVAEDSLDNRIFASVWEVALRRVSDRAVAATELIDDTLRGFGTIRRKDHELWAGERLLNDERQILPRISRATSLGLAIYLGNRRVASWSVLDAGDAQPVGGYADALVVDSVLRRRETFRGTLDRGGRPFVVACRPLYARDRSDEYGPVGMLEAYQDQETFRQLIAGSLNENVGAEIMGGDEMESDRVAAVVQFVEDVARRLQLLALNGNIIAAQAGDHGRAFRVVCRELSSLAEQAKETLSDARKHARPDDGSADAGAALEASVPPPETPLADEA
jgi:hypothetical protein